MYLVARISSEAWGDESAQQHIFRDAIQNGTVRIPVRSCIPSRSRCVQCIKYTSHVIVFASYRLTRDSCVIIYRTEMFLEDIKAMSDKKHDIMIRKVRLYVYIYVMHPTCAPTAHHPSTNPLPYMYMHHSIICRTHYLWPASVASTTCVCALLYTQEKLVYESKFCPKEACGSPMVPYMHQGEKKMRCSKKKCNHITREHVSVYYHQSGTPCIAIQ